MATSRPTPRWCSPSPRGRPPLALAEALAARLLELPEVESAEIAKPGFVNLRLADAFWRAPDPRSRCGPGDDYGADRPRPRPRGQRRVLLGQPERAAARRPRPRHGVRRCAGQPAGADGLARGARVLRQRRRRCRWTALARSVHHRYLAALGAAPARAARRLLSGRLPDPARPRDRRAGRRALARCRGERVAAGVPSARGRRDAGADQGRSRGARRAPRRVHLGGRADRGRARSSRRSAALERRGLVYTGTLPPPKGKPSEDWEPVPLLLFRATALRRRRRPAAQEQPGRLDLSRRRPRLPPGQGRRAVPRS